MLSRFALIGLLIVLAAGLVAGAFAVPSRPALTVPVSAPIAVQPSTAPADLKPTNPVVEPGKVHWHATTEAALAAAKESKKPVLVFHMMGQLDHQFC